MAKGRSNFKNKLLRANKHTNAPHFRFIARYHIYLLLLILCTALGKYHHVYCLNSINRDRETHSSKSNEDDDEDDDVSKKKEPPQKEFYLLAWDFIFVSSD